MPDSGQDEREYDSGALESSRERVVREVNLKPTPALWEPGLSGSNPHSRPFCASRKTERENNDVFHSYVSG